MKTPVSFPRLALCVVALAALAACQKSPAPTAAPEAKAPPKLQGGLQPGDTVTVVNCTQPQPDVCAIAVVATAPAGGSGDACNVAVEAAVSLPKSTTTLRWQLQESDANFNYRFRAGADGQSFGVRLIDNLMYVPEAVSPPASAASSPMHPIWVPQVAQPGLVQMERVARIWPPRISAYDIYLEYQPKDGGAKGWTSCKTWDPIIVSQD